jgi:hypothetical protein
MRYSRAARALESRGQEVKGLKDAELKMAAEIVFEIAKGRGRSFDTRAMALKLCRAALVDQGFRARLAEVHRRLEVQRASMEPRRLLAPIAVWRGRVIRHREVGRFDRHPRQRGPDSTCADTPLRLPEINPSVFRPGIAQLAEDSRLLTWRLKVTHYQLMLVTR